MRRILLAIDAFLGRPAGGWAALALALLLYAGAYLRHDLSPGTGAGATARGWWTWSDQAKYLAEAGAIAELRLDAASYAYPVGYPALGALFWRWMPAHAFLIPNLLLMAGFSTVWWRLARRWLGPLASATTALLFVSIHRWLLRDTMVVPWNTLPTQLTLLAGIWLVVAATGVRAAFGIAALAAVTYGVRPIDVVPFGALFLFAVLRLPNIRQRAWVALAGAAVVAAAVGLVAALNGAVFAHWQSPYEAASTQTIGFFSYPVSYKCFWLLVDGRPLFRETDPALLFRYPWLYLVIPAAAYWWACDRWRAAAALTAIALSWMGYLNYNDFLPSDVYRFTLIHYLAWSFPLLFLMVVAAVRHGWAFGGVRYGLLASAVLFAIATGLRMDERALGLPPMDVSGWRIPDERPLLLRFSGIPLGAVSRLRLDGARLVECSDYLVPYVGSDLQLLLGTRRRGTWLQATGGTPALPAPEMAEYVWRWRWNPGRVKRLCR